MADRSLDFTLEIVRADLQEIQKHKAFSNQILAVLKLLESGKNQSPVPLEAYAVFHRIIVGLWGVVDGLSDQIEGSCMLLEILDRKVVDLKEKNGIMESLLEKRQHPV